MGMDLDRILKGLVIKRTTGPVEGEVTGLIYHSDQAAKGKLFFALPGTQAHGWEFAVQAVDKGALAAVLPEDAPYLEIPSVRVPDTRLALAVASDIYYSHPSGKLRMIGVTGTNGKTTTTHLINAILEKNRHRTGLLGTIDYRVVEENFPVKATTPESCDLQEMLYYMNGKEVSHAVLEVSSHALAWHRVSGCDFDVAVLTNVTADHLDFHGDFSSYLASKASLFAEMGGKFLSQGRPRVAIINKDDPSYSYVSSMAASQVVSYGLDSTCDVRATELAVDREKTRFKVKTFAGEFELNLELRGTFNVYNSLAAVATGLIEGVDLQVIKKALEEVSGIPGRFERVDAGQDFTVVIDYAHTADGLENVLQTARQLLDKGKLITVFGCGGDRDRAKRSLMGEIAGKYSDYCVITSDNPRSEEPEAIIEDVIPGIKKEKEDHQIQSLVDRQQAITIAINLAQKNDLVVVAGKGHEEYQVFKDRVIPFSDRKIARDAIKQRLE